MNKRLIIITRTYEFERRLEYIERAAKHIALAKPNAFWLVIEDDARISPKVHEIISRYWKPHEFDYVPHGPTRNVGSEQVIFAYQQIGAGAYGDGIVYVADCDNFWHPLLWNELRKTDQLSVIPIGNLGVKRSGVHVERPIVIDGTIVAWDAGLSTRVFPVDYGAFAITKKRLEVLEPGFWKRSKPMQESAFLRIVANDLRGKMEPLADDCTVILAWHNVELGDPKERGEWGQLTLPKATWEISPEQALTEDQSIEALERRLGPLEE